MNGKEFAARTSGNDFRVTSILVVISALVLCGCAKSGPSKDISANAFDSAPPDLKQTWNEGLAAWKNHRFAQAATNFLSLQLKAATLSSQQTESLTKSMEQLGQEAFEAANKGDADATEAVKVLRGTGRRSGR
jgi:hypothetical protein